MQLWEWKLVKTLFSNRQPNKVETATASSYISFLILYIQFR